MVRPGQWLPPRDGFVGGLLILKGYVTGGAGFDGVRRPHLAIGAAQDISLGAGKRRRGVGAPRVQLAEFRPYSSRAHLRDVASDAASTDGRTPLVSRLEFDEAIDVE